MHCMSRHFGKVTWYSRISLKQLILKQVTHTTNHAHTAAFQSCHYQVVVLDLGIVILTNQPSWS